MKKFILCIGTLGLAACGGGSGGGGDGTMANYVVSDVVRISQVPEDVIASNRQVTSMSSEVLISGTETPDTVARQSSGHVMFGGREYTAYRLDDVEFETNSPDYKDMSFVLDTQGQIVGLRIAGELYNRLSNSNLFETASGTKVQYNSLGKGQGENGLRYSDFGTVVFNPPSGGIAQTNTHDMIFVGGYDATEVDKDRFATDMTFTGAARGVVSNNAESVNLSDDNATLTVNHSTGLETFAASFSNWYDVNITRDQSDMVTFTLVGDNKNENNYAALNTPTKMADETQNSGEGIKFSTEYYGSPITGNASESTALINYYQGANTDRTNVSIGFGGAAQ